MISSISCPTCDNNLDAAVSLTDTLEPAAGKPTVCPYCGEILTLTTDGIRVSTSDDLKHHTQQNRELILLTHSLLTQLCDRFRPRTTK